MSTLAFVSADQSSITVALTNTEAAGTVFTIELNRSPDFAADDSLFMSPGAVAAGTTNLVLRGLPSGTPWWIRAISATTNAITPLVLVATSTVVPSTAYAGFSVDKAMLVVPADLTGLTASFSTGSPRTGYPVGNLLLDSPQATFQANGNMVCYIDFETSGEPIDTISMLGMILGDQTGWAIQAFSNPSRAAGTMTFTDGILPMCCSPSIGRRQFYHSLYHFAVPRTERSWRIQIETLIPTFIARHLVVGLARQSVNASKGNTEGLNDLGTATRSRFGDPDRVIGWRGKTVDFEMSWMKEAEYQTKWADLPVLVGKTKSVLAIPNPKRNVFLNDRMAYGTISEWRAATVGSRHITQSISIDSLY